ncbi:hypothetical protein MGMO_97c00050 [Methyloglobulus morosus KoM1]|uniref:MAPEG family protein n=1 Tax=Methyloglobulus morosus KoM1 TaxID=1116472 RepID=V5BZ79_9GAMM|nr:hypothetical protein [Methyloglobulus morosus]ESS71527.1 hypothetical protein MGMO_97c00050 [Methyloglobulus morosus KoM1]
MNKDQKKVAIGAASGVIGMVILVTLLYSNLPAPAGMGNPFDRVIFTLRMNLVAALPLFIGIVTVGNNRFLSEAIDPLRHAEDRATVINGRFVDNTLQQNFLFLVGTLALSTFLEAASMKLMIALTLVFVLARIAFWIGYRIDPLYRAPGMAATIYMNLGIILSVLYFLVF